MKQIFNLLIQNKLNPNQFYLLYSIHENIATVRINIHQELRILESEGWIFQPEKRDSDITEWSSNLWVLQPKSITLIQEIDCLFVKQKKKVNLEVLGTDYNKMISEYLSIFPKIKLPSGKAARNDEKSIADAFKWFFENYKYPWDLILKATMSYVDEYQRKNYLYMRTSKYFIRKQLPDKTWDSELADYCNTELNGGLDEEQIQGDKVV